MQKVRPKLSKVKGIYILLPSYNRKTSTQSEQCNNIHIRINISDSNIKSIVKDKEFYDMNKGIFFWHIPYTCINLMIQPQRQSQNKTIQNYKKKWTNSH